MPKFRVVATMNVGYAAIIEAKDEKHAWSIAANDCTPTWKIMNQDLDDMCGVNWYKIDDGHEWKLVDVYNKE